MASRDRDSHYDSYEDDYSDDFDDDADTGNKRYKTRSPILRTASENEKKSTNRPKNSRSSDSKLLRKKPGAGSVKSQKTRPGSPLGSNTYRKARGGMSLASGYYTPSRKSVDDSEDYYTPRSAISEKSEYMSPAPGRESTIKAAKSYKTVGSRTHSVSPNKRVFNRTNRGRGGRGRGKASQNTGRMSTDRTDNVARRVMSARRLKINELANQNQELIHQMKDMKEENRLLKKTHRRQENALTKFEDRESDLPQLIQRQNNETRSLRDQIRKWREKFEKSDRYLRDAEDELEKVKSKFKKLTNLADEKDLPERSELNKKLNASELDMEAKDVKIRELERYIQNLEKNHRHELGIERARQRDINRQLMELRESNDKLQTNVKEKEKEIQMKNIYANRMVKPPHRLPNSYSGTPHGTPPPHRRRPSLSENTGITPRERAKHMELKRREDLRKQRELKQRRIARAQSQRLHDRPPSHRSNPRTPLRNRSQSPSHHGIGDINGDYVRSPTLRDSYVRSPALPRDFLSPAPNKLEQHENLKREQDLRKQQEREQKEQEERQRRQMEEKEQREYEQRERQMNDEASRDEEDRKMREERDRMKREAEERQRVEKERKEKEDRARKEKRDREERERRDRERLEQERRAQEDRRRFEDDVTLQSERKKKDEILQKLREIDEGPTSGKSKEKSKKDNKDSDPFFVTQTAKDREDSISSESSKKDYAFTKPTQNLHQGKPARKQVFNPKSTTGTSDRHRHRDIDDIEQGGYNPTLGAADKGGSSKKAFSLFDDDDQQPTHNKPAQKSRLMADLFGSSNDNDTPTKNDMFASPAKSQPKKSTQSSNMRTSFPWDSEGSKTSGSTFKAKRENSATLFGGGSALVNDEEINSSSGRNNGLLARRPKASTTTFHNRPTVNAIDNFDDDIEEVIL